MKYAYIVNRFNHKNATDGIIRKLEEVSLAFDRDYEIVVNDTVEDVKRNMARFRDTEYVITGIGGDGSINLILNDMIDTNNILSYIPVGTGNDFYKANLEYLEDGIHEVDVIRINDRYFINVACFGVDADIANDDRFIHNKLIPESMRYNAGVLYYFLTYRPKTLTVSVNGQSITQQVTTVVVANARYYGNGYKVAPVSDIDDGLMEVYVVDRLNKARMAGIILSMKNAKHLSNPALKAFVTDRLTISSPEEISANIDGEPLKAKHFDIEIIPKRIRLDFDSKFIARMREVKYR